MTIELGYQLSSEEHPAPDLVGYARRAEEAGFSYAVISDHFHPWTHRQGQAPFVWAVLGAIAQATGRLRLGDGGDGADPANAATSGRALPPWRPCFPGASSSASARART